MKKTLLLILGLLVISYSDFAQKQSTVEKDSVIRLSEVVVTASRTPESILKSPVSIELLDAKHIKQSPAPSYFDAIENIKAFSYLHQVWDLRCITLVDLPILPTSVLFSW
ncbi:hypothetical protein ACFFJX_30675 [Pseudarcicella hirudinis]|uniref:hypothetical protein n=1 Tax=Pseudarcicella hirudinis TaxID=1079859 RepID=UPI0035EF0F04